MTEENCSATTARELMTNDETDQFYVWIYAKKNQVNGWSTRTLEDARESARLFFQESEHYRSRAVVMNKLTDSVLEEIANPETESQFKDRKRKG
jgi:hypothetical protein